MSGTRGTAIRVASRRRCLPSLFAFDARQNLSRLSTSANGAPEARDGAGKRPSHAEASARVQCLPGGGLSSRVSLTSVLLFVVVHQFSSGRGRL